MGKFRSEVACATQLRGCCMDRGDDRNGSPPGYEFRSFNL